MRAPPHEATTAQLGALYPFVASPPLAAAGVYVGRDLHGGAFFHDPFALYRAGVLTNPNMLVLGQIGRGKSSLVKTYCYRHAAFGRRIVVFDPKGEYGPLAEALGTRPVRLRPGGELRLNPLAAATGARRLALLSGLAVTCLGRALAPIEDGALEVALDAVVADGAGEATLPAVVDALLEPTAAAAAALRSGLAELRAETRALALGLRRLVGGQLAGMFDGPSTPGVELDGAAVVLDLSALYRSSALPALLACAMAALEPSWVAASRLGRQSLLVVDEAWAVLADPGVARFLQSSWKLARSNGVANIAVVHRVSDLKAAGAQGSVLPELASGLLADSETVVCYGQAPGEVEATASALGLGEREAGLLARLGRGVGLWRVGAGAYLVEHRLGPRERALVDTDGALR